MFSPQQLCVLTDLARRTLESSRGTFVEVGCAYGNTALFLNRFLEDDLGIQVPYHCIDTFEGFTDRDSRYEISQRGKRTHQETFQNAFLDNHPKYLKRAMANEGFDHVEVHRADASTFDYTELEPISFCLIDVDLYLPVRATLEKIHHHLASDAIVVVDDCAKGGPWDGAYDAYREFIAERSMVERVVGGKLGVILADEMP